jgi:prephenate dehydrogenase
MTAGRQTTLGLVGTGHIGGSFALALRAAGAVHKVVGHDLDPAAARRARDRGIVDEIGLLDGCDVVVLAVPVRAIPECAEGTHIAPGAVVTDVGSTKRDIVARGEQAFGARFVGGHPIAGTERAGPDAADAALFRGRRAILTPTATTDPAARARVAALWRAAGAEVIEMDAALHDRVMALISHLPHVVAYALAGAVAPHAAELAGMSGGGFVDTTRIASTPPAMWIDVLIENRDAVLEALDGYEAELAALRAAIVRADAAAIAQLLAAARAARERILS